MSTDDSFSICDICLGSDKHLKMMKHVNGEECKSCTRPFTVYRWNADSSSHKSKKTVICMTCARAKNCCQSCMLDINYHIPLHIRDTALQMAGLDKMVGYNPGSTKNREIKAIMADKKDSEYRRKDENESEDQSQLARDILTKLSDKLNEQGTSFKKAPKSLRTPEDKLKNVDVSKILAKLPFGGSIDKSSNPDLTSFFIFGIGDEVPQYLITDLCNTHGKVKNLTIVHKAKCGFVTFLSRQSAESLADSIANNGLNKNTTTAGLVILDNKYPVRVAWGKPKPLGTTNEEHHKISLIVSKVMKQLAEKDRGVGTKPAKEVKSKVRQKAITSEPKYKSAGNDYEI